MTPEAAFDHCAGEVRRNDHDRYLCALFAPASARPAFFALAAFNLALAQVADGVSEPMLGQIRLQWWRDAIAEVGGSPPDHPVVVAIDSAARRHGLARDLLMRLVEARTFDLAAEPPSDTRALEDYAEATAGTLTILQLAALGVDGDDPAVTAGRHVGAAWALVGLVRATPYLASAGRVVLPRDRLAAAGLAPDRVPDDADGALLEPVVREVIDLAAGRLAEARALRRRTAVKALPALLPAALADLYIRRIRRAGYDPYIGAESVAGPRRQLRLLVSAALGRY